MDRETDEIARRFVKKLTNNYKIEKVILFGSRARGDHFKMNDFDFIIVSPDFRGVHIIERMSSIYEYWDEPYDIEPLSYTPEEFEARMNELGIVSAAIKEGILVPVNQG